MSQLQKQIPELPYKTVSSAIFHSNTKTSRDNKIIENNLLRNLQSVTKSIHDKTRDQNVARWTYIFGILKPALENLVHSYIRSAVTNSYILGAQYSVRAIDKRLPFYLTDKDLSKMKEVSKEYTDKYWNRIQTSFNSKVIQENPDSILNPKYVDEPIAISTATRALAEGTRVKAESLLLANRGGRVIQAALSPDKGETLTPSLLKSRAETVNTVREFFDRELELLRSIPEEQRTTMNWIWLTAANACKNLCEPIRGVKWNAAIEFPYYPPRHPNCRCRLFLIPGTA